jgi:hypothetical protein
MKLSQLETFGALAIIAYIAFASRPPPMWMQIIVQNPVGQAILLAGIVYVSVRVNYILALLLMVAFVVTVRPTFEYLDPKEQTPSSKQPKSAAVPAPPAKDILQTLMKMGERMPHTSDRTPAPKPTSHVPPKPASGKEHFASF